MGSRLAWIVASGLVVVCVGCGGEPKGGPRVETFPVTGKVLVDGAPAAGVLVGCHPQGEASVKRQLTVYTDEEGAFSIGTYEAGDGLPEGEYKLTFEWIQGPMLGPEKGHAQEGLLQPGEIAAHRDGHQGQGKRSRRDPTEDEVTPAVAGRPLSKTTVARHTHTCRSGCHQWRPDRLSFLRLSRRSARTWPDRKRSRFASGSSRHVKCWVPLNCPVSFLR